MSISSNGWIVLAARNPTGQCIRGEDLKELVHVSKNKATIILDEFYSW